MNIKDTRLYKRVINRSNIYSSIYCVESYIFEKDLLSQEDIKLLNELRDKFNFKLINHVMISCEKKLKEIFLKEETLFEISVYLKPKKYDYDTEQAIFRPMHTANLITQICLVCMLNQIMFDDSDGKTRKLSDISKLLPSNFYGNIPSTNVSSLFVDWKTKYKEYSEAFISAYKEYSSTKKYKYEIVLDLVNFFPSINPNIVNKIILEKLSTIYIGDEMECLKMLIKKMLYFKMHDISEYAELYYGLSLKSIDSIEIIKEKKLFYSVGIPQGLPQAYFFANLCMIDISKEFDASFKGESYYYVDDSVIYANDLSVEEFPEKLKKLNAVLATKYIQEEFDFLDIPSFERLVNYEIKIHPTGKSSISEIDKKYGQVYLEFLAKQASTVPFDIATSSDEFEDSTLKEKIAVFQLATEKEIQLLKDTMQEDESNSTAIRLEERNNYLKLLKRYQKFFKYRLKIMELRDNNKISESDVIDFYNKYSLDLKNDDKTQIEKLFKMLDEDIFLAEAHMIIRQLSKNPKKQKEILSSISKLEKKLSTGKLPSNYYFEKVLTGNIIKLEYKTDKYETLDLIISKKIEPYTKVNSQNEIKELSNIITILNKGELLLIKDYLGIETDYIEFIYYSSSEFKRIIINGVISRIMCVNINDSYNFLRMDSRSLKYYQLRLLAFVRNKYFDIKQFVLFSEEVLNDFKKGICSEKIDFSILEVLPIFKRYVKSPKNIDELILTHKYVNGIWKNGSKFLHFYTMHNEEHSIELINRTLDITKSIDYYDLKEMDYFILFLSCYLHDVSMVLYPKLNRFAEPEMESDLIYSQWKIDFLDKIKCTETAPKSLIKNFIKDYYEKVNNYFEVYIRDNHAKASSRFINDTNDLYFIDKAVKAFVSKISEAHGYNCKDVYGLKSNAKNDIISDKYLMILLRLADLLDMTKDRVSLNILRQNIKNMPDMSKFHWISHLAIDKCEVHTKYELYMPEEDKVKSYLKKELFHETVCVDIYLNTKQLTAIKSNNCEHLKSKINEDKIAIEIIDDKTHKCSSPCSFLCKWMARKHNYLFEELYELQKYLRRNPSNRFETHIRCNLYYSEDGNIPGDYIDIVKSAIEK